MFCLSIHLSGGVGVLGYCESCFSERWGAHFPLRPCCLFFWMSSQESIVGDSFGMLLPVDRATQTGLIHKEMYRFLQDERLNSPLTHTQLPDGSEPITMAQGVPFTHWLQLGGMDQWPARRAGSPGLIEPSGAISQETWMLRESSLKLDSSMELGAQNRTRDRGPLSTSLGLTFLF